MRTFYTLAVILVASLFTGLQAQFRYLDATFDVEPAVTDTFGRNIDPYRLLLASNMVPVDPFRHLEMDVYQPANDDAELRPVVVLFHTGNFLPQFLNNGVYGTRKDSAMVELSTRLAQRGYVAMSADYREGWDPASTVLDVRTSTLLQAAYRGGQDAHTMARYLRSTVVDEGNPYRIDTSRIVFWGHGTGGYVTLAHAFLDRIDEVLADDRFYDLNDQPYVSLAVNADPQGTLPAQLAPNVPSNVPNHVGFSSNIAMTVNSEGALGDIDWMEGKDNEPITTGFHSLTDENAPFSFGEVIVPTTGEVVITGVAGTEQVLEKANALGLNDAISSVNATSLSGIYGDLAEAINVRNEELKMRTVDPDPNDITGFPEFEVSHDNMFTFIRSDTASGLYNWTGEAALRASFAAYSAVPWNQPRMLDGEDGLITDALDSNPDLFNGAAARLYIDTMMAHFLPRAYVGLNLEGLVGTNELVDAAAIGLEVFPNPANVGFTVRTETGHPMRSIRILDFGGRVVRTITGINATSRFIERDNLPRGAYLLQLQLDEGTTARKLILE